MLHAYGLDLIEEPFEPSKFERMATDRGYVDRSWFGFLPQLGSPSPQVGKTKSDMGARTPSLVDLIFESIFFDFYYQLGLGSPGAGP